MDEPKAKRAKMDNPNGQGSSTSPKSPKVQRALIDISTQEFNVIRDMPGFVDHTHFIGVFLRLGALAIFAPRRFGKSSHLDMVFKFLQADVDDITGEVSSSMVGPANGRKNYKLFEGTRIITDDKNKELVERHLGKHPVIRLDFKDASVDSVESAEMRCRRAVHNAYKKHSYLTASTKLDSDDKEGNAGAQLICKEWCHDKLYKTQDLRDCLKNLTRYLYNHYNKAEVYILVDEFDAIYASAHKIFKNPDANRVKKPQDIYNMLGCLLGPVTKGCKLVGGVLFTGISYVAGRGFSGNFNNIQIMQFLDHHNTLQRDQNFVPFYGATKEEVESLIQKLVENKELTMFEEKEEFLNDTNELDVKKIMDVVQSRYNGYFNVDGKRIFCLWSVLQYLQSGIARNYWNATDKIQNLYMILESPDVAHHIIKLMRSEMIELKRVDYIYVNDLVELYDLLAAENEDKVYYEKVYSGVVFNFLIDHGYLTYPEGGASEGEAQYAQFQLPNAEVRAALSNMIGNIVTERWKSATTSCTNLINDISLSLMDDKKALRDKMLNVHKAISLIMSPLEQTNRAHLNESRMSCIMYKALNDAKSFELCVDLPVKDADGQCITSDRSDYLLHHKKDKFSILWEIKYAADYRNKYTTSLYALQEARGIVAIRNGKTKKYMDALKELQREALVIGLSINSDLKVSLSYAAGKEQKIYFMSETEPTSFPDLFKTYDTESLPLEENDD